MTPRQRKQASTSVRGHPGATSPPAEPETGDFSTLRKLAQELQIHQVELEMQNQALREAQHELEESRDRFANLFDFAPVGYATVNEAGVILSVNLTLTSLLEKERSRLEGQLLVSLLTFESRSAVRQMLDRCIRTRAKQEADVVMRARERGDLYVQLVIEPVQQHQGEESFLVAVVDSTEKVLARRGLQEAEAKLTEALDATRTIAWSHDFGTDTTTTSPNTPDVLGVSASRTYRIHKEMLKDIPDPDRESYERILDAAINGRSSYVAQFRLLSSRSGEIRWFEERGRVDADGSGKACRLRGILYEITERKGAEEALLLNFHRLMAFVTDTVDPVALLDGQGGITCISKAGAALLGYRPEELAGRGGAQLAHPDDARIAQARLAELREHRKDQNIMIRLQRKDGSWGWYDLDGSMVVQEGNQIGFVVKISGVDLYSKQPPGL